MGFKVLLAMMAAVIPASSFSPSSQLRRGARRPTFRQTQPAVGDVSESSGAAEWFRPTEEWREVDEGVQCPRGLEFKIDLETGRKLGRIPPGGSEKFFADLRAGAAAADGRSASAERMRQKLEAESEAPFFYPLLGASAVVGGKGLTDACLTIAKVTVGVRGASLADEFFGIPVLAIDAACMAAGGALAAWTWENQRPKKLG